MTSFSITRRAHSTAIPAHVLPLVTDFHQWERWSPWEGLDPQLQRTYSGAEHGAGSVYAWQGNKKAGAGSMTMTATDHEGAEIDLRFTRPFRAENHVSLRVTPAGDGGTDLSWTMSGQQSLMNRVFFRIFRMEKALSQDFDRGLAQLVAQAEQDAATPGATSPGPA